MNRYGIDDEAITDVGFFYPYAYKHFIKLPNSFKWGVLVDFFDSVGLNIEISFYSLEPHPYPFSIRIKPPNGAKRIYAGIQNKFETRTEARTAAIEKANQIYNS